MKRTCGIICRLTIGVCLATAANAQSSAAPPATGLPSADELTKRDSFTIGAGAVILPDYEGSADYRIIPAGAIRAKVHGISVSTNGSYLNADLVPQSGKFGFDAGPIIGLRFDDRRRGDEVVKRMIKRNTAYEAGGFVGISRRGLLDPYDMLSLRLDVIHDVGHAHRSTVFDPHVDFSTPVSRKTYVSFSAGAEIVNSRYAGYYFGVSPADVAATGGALPLYSPRGGVKNWKASLLVDQAISGDLLGGFSIFGLAQYSRLLGDFKRSPIVEARGSANQWIGAAGLAYTW